MINLKFINLIADNMNFKMLFLGQNIFLIILLFNFYTSFSQSKTFPALDTAVLSKVEVEASFPGGEAAWTKYVSNALKDAEIRWKNADQGTCRIRFIVDKRGYISDVEAMNMKKTRLAKFAVDIISNGPKWKPASQNGKFVNAYREQPVTLTLSDK